MLSIDTLNRLTPLEPALSQGRLMRALSAIDDVRLARNAADCLERLHQATQAIGANAGLYAVVIPEQGPRLSCITLFACDPGFAQQIFDLGPVQRHPWVRFARTHTAPGTGTHVQVGSDSEAAAIQLARDHGFGTYLIVPTLAGAELGRVELLCLGKGPDESFDGEGQRIVRMLARALAAELHDWFSVYLRAALLRAARLQAQDVELLAFEWDGLSSKEIAVRTGMSVAAVDSRFQRLNQRLNCPSRKASARRAAEHSVLEAVWPDVESMRQTRLRGAAGPGATSTRSTPAQALLRRSGVPASP